MANGRNFIVLALFIVTLFLNSTEGLAARKEKPKSQVPAWAYDAGPSVNEPMGRELIDIYSEIPPMPGVSSEVLGKQKFRPQFGPVGWRMLLPPNSVKILFIGQDATHIAEAAGRTATAGFGGRAQDLANYLGVDSSAGFINTYTFTIKGQYGSFSTPFVVEEYDETQVPVVEKQSDGKIRIRSSGYVDEKLWLMTHDPKSPIAKWRNRLIDWIVRNNKDSIKLIVLFGGAARDGIASFIQDRGGQVAARRSVESMRNIQMPVTDLVHAGGNNEFPILLTPDGEDLYSQLAGRKLDYKKLEDQKLAAKLLQEKTDEAIKRMVFTKAGPFENGLIDPAQLGGFDLDSIVINGQNTRSLKGLKLSDGSIIGDDVVVLELPHPSALSRLSAQEASEKVATALKILAPYQERGWRIDADPGFKNQFEEGKPYKYARAQIGPEFYDFGTPKTRMVPVSTASRMPRNPHVIVFGTREKVKFDSELIVEMTNAKPTGPIDPDELFTMRPRTPELRYSFDPGPSEDVAKLIKENLDLSEIFKLKRGKTWEKNGIQAFSVRTHPDVGDFGHYRGTFNSPKVLILADPDGVDDLITARALTGARGQYLHGLMQDLKVDDQYLLIKTLPFGMDEASESDWTTSLRRTDKYREEILRHVLKGSSPELIIADGKHAAAELQRILGQLGLENKIPIVHIARRGLSNNFGIVEAGERIAKLSPFRGAEIRGEMADIPRSHLSFYARIWEGTSGDRVATAQDENKGLAFAEVAPKWAWTQKVRLGQEAHNDVEGLKEILFQNGFLMPGESIQDYVKRKNEGKVPKPARDIRTARKSRKKSGNGGDCPGALENLSR